MLRIKHPWWYTHEMFMSYFSYLHVNHAYLSNHHYCGVCALLDHRFLCWLWWLSSISTARILSLRRTRQNKRQDSVLSIVPPLHCRRLKYPLYLKTHSNQFGAGSRVFGPWGMGTQDQREVDLRSSVVLCQQHDQDGQFHRVFRPTSGAPRVMEMQWRWLWWSKRWAQEKSSSSLCAKRDSPVVWLPSSSVMCVGNGPWLSVNEVDWLRRWIGWLDCQ